MPERVALKVCDHATYVGYVPGPGVGRHRWAKPVEKWEARAAEIAVRSPLVTLAARQYVARAPQVLDHLVAMSARPSDRCRAHW